MGVWRGPNKPTGGPRPGSGRPRRGSEKHRQSLAKAASEAEVKLGEKVPMLIEVLLKDAGQGNAESAKYLLNRFFGTPRTARHHLSDVGTIKNILEAMARGELAKPTAEGVEQAAAMAMAVLTNNAAQGDVASAKALLDRCLGQPEQTITVRAANMTREEALAALQELYRRQGLPEAEIAERCLAAEYARQEVGVEVLVDAEEIECE